MALAALLLAAACGSAPRLAQEGRGGEAQGNADVIALPAPSKKGTMSLEETLVRRRSVRSFQDQALTRAQIGQLLWAAQGITSARGFRTAPSAGALYPLEVYIATANGVFRYEPGQHRLRRTRAQDVRSEIHAAALRQRAVGDAPALFVITAIYARTARKYGGRAERYVRIEAGHAAQNLLLQAVALGLGAVPIGAFDDDDVRACLGAPEDHAPLYIIPVGRP
jgi:SagB-type dehydrogenase family enzyme